jgi:hypothetical protein
MALRIRNDRLSDIWWGYAAAVLAAGAAIALSIAAMVVISSSGSAQSLATRIGTGFALAAFMSIYVLPFTFLLALLPATAAILYSEQYGVRSPIAYALLGVLVGVASFACAIVLFDLVTYHPSRPAGMTSMVELIRQLAVGAFLFVIPGLCGGLTYWARAGRYSGN